MIPAKRQPAFEWLFSHIVHAMLKQHFSAVYVRGESKRNVTGPMLLFSNHSNWWDGLVCFYLSRSLLRKDVYMMMHEKGLKQHPYFSWIGAFSVDKSSQRDIMRSLHYAEARLQDQHTVWLFPQGDEYHQDTRPLLFEPGLSYLSQCQGLHTPPTIYSIAFYYSYIHRKKPGLFIDISAHLPIKDWEHLNRKQRSLYFENALTEQLNSLRTDVLQRSYASFDVLL
ncbi:lysophospholipid acyltransferase family protein [Aureibacillus halotolerans]|uniref:1-acyl-sn-glycerol-3-phosphate acyltransferase n=1 Tax=Aureibacillus halotolerans TaxID=1508390 RepID=A0A4R6UAZ0_9BACI|nr:lysophospholipid acyltransferase family protein [Aureibacillus halotolerans]TDQ42089.1 1-acyl-sn-glycerol-3-phosphate acyltransferase [Aureibacillus halotolerans]